MRKKIMTLMMGTLLLLTACGQTGNSSASTMLPVAAVQSAAQGVAGVADKTADKAEMPQKEEKPRTVRTRHGLSSGRRHQRMRITPQKSSLQPLKRHRPLPLNRRQHPRLRRRINRLLRPRRHLHRSRQRNRRKSLRLCPNLSLHLSRNPNRQTAGRLSMRPTPMLPRSTVSSQTEV